MALYLVQHGVCLSKDIDPGQGLSDEGKAIVKRIAEVANAYNVKISEIWHSGKKRTLETAEIFAFLLKPERGIHEVSGIKPLDDVQAAVENIKIEDNIMVTGHLPFIQKMISYLVTGSEEPAIFKVQNGGIVCIDIDQDTMRPIIKWALMPSVG